MLKTVEMDFEFQGIIDRPPVEPQRLYSQACSNDTVTIESWRDIWIKNIRENRERFGSFKEKGVGKLFGKFKYHPAILAGSGPSLKNNVDELKDKKDLPLISCLHNFHYFEDRDIEVDFYVTLDAGDITVEEVYEGGTHEESWYWDRSKGKKLIAFIGSSPKLLEKWQGEIYFFNAPIPDNVVTEEIEKLEVFNTHISNGGNVLGACLYLAKGIFGCNPICFVGADFAFSYTKKFHAWNSKYDANLGHVISTTDVWGNKVYSWQSYMNFKSWFDYISLAVPGIYINATEGGCLGAYKDGNLLSIRQMHLKEFLRMFHVFEELRDQCENPETKEKKILF